MATGPITAAELLKINDLNMDLVDANELLEQSPVLAMIPAIESSNSEYHKWDIKNVGMAADFRAVNDGRVTTHSERRVEKIDLENLDASHETDVQSGRRHRLGTDGYIEQQTVDAFQSAFAKEERQFFYGKQVETNVDPDGNPFGAIAGHQGLSDFWGVDNALFNPMITLVNTGATGAGFRTSVWLLRTVNPLRNVATVMGFEGFEMLEPRLVTREGDNSGGSAAIKHGAWWVDIEGLWGFQYGTKRSAFRIANIDSSAAGTGNLEVTDDVIGAAISKFPANQGPNLICMTREGLRQLRESRSATVQTTEGSYAAFPDESHRVPIVTTDQLSNNEDEVIVT